MDGDIHLSRAQLFAQARFSFPEMGLKGLMSLQVGDYQPPNP